MQTVELSPIKLRTKLRGTNPLFEDDFTYLDTQLDEKLMTRVLEDEDNNEEQPVDPVPVVSEKTKKPFKQYRLQLARCLNKMKALRLTPKEVILAF